MTWNYRIIRRQFPSGGYEYSFHEVYYKRDRVIEFWSSNPIAPHGETVKELKTDHHHMLLAFDKPVLEEQDGKLIDVDTSSHTSEAIKSQE